MKVLVTGGAGYIGSHAVRGLLNAGHGVVVVDNLFRGHRAAVPAGVSFVELDLRETDALTRALAGHDIDCVMHFAALAYVGESVNEPLLYYDNNCVGSLSVLQAMDALGIRRMVFSSTCATYGEPRTMPIDETCAQSPVNPYGWTKLFTEKLLADYAEAHDDFSFAALRYFNVAGSASDGSIGEDHDPESHLIPILLQAALGKRSKVTIFGDDYETPDGTCIRDYIHVEDLVDAHMAVMMRLGASENENRLFYNLGIGRGLSVLDVLQSARRVTGADIPSTIGPRRAGDPPALYANAEKIQDEIGWQAKLTDIDSIIETAWRWMKDHPEGYGGYGG